MKYYKCLSAPSETGFVKGTIYPFDDNGVYRVYDHKKAKVLKGEEPVPWIEFTIKDGVFTPSNKDEFYDQFNNDKHLKKSARHLIICGNQGAGKTRLIKWLETNMPQQQKYIKFIDTFTGDAIAIKEIVKALPNHLFVIGCQEVPIGLSPDQFEYIFLDYPQLANQLDKLTEPNY